MNVLVVEDVADVALTFAALIRAYGHRTQVAYDGASALRIAREFRPKVIFVDIGLPDTDGYDLARKLREVEGLSEAYLVSISGRELDRPKFEEAGLNLHLKKPITINALIGILGNEHLVAL